MRVSSKLREELVDARNEAERNEQEAASYNADSQAQASSSNTGVALGAILSKVGQNHFESDARKARNRMRELESEIERLGDEVSVEETEIARAVATPHADTVARIDQQAQTDATMAQLRAGAAEERRQQQLAAQQAAQQQRLAAQQRLAVHQSAQQAAQRRSTGSGDSFHCVGASGADSGYNNGCQVVSGQGANGGSSGTSGSATNGNPASSSGASVSSSGGNGNKYVTPISSSCVRAFYDPQTYNWLAFENQCGQAIDNVFVFAPSDGNSMHLTAGQHASTGRSQNEVAQKGGYKLFVCPEGSIPVDMNDSSVTFSTPSFRCKLQ